MSARQFQGRMCDYEVLGRADTWVGPGCELFGRCVNGPLEGQGVRIRELRCDDPHDAARVLRPLCDLRHANIISVLDVAVSDERQYYVVLFPVLGRELIYPMRVVFAEARSPSLFVVLRVGLDLLCGLEALQHRQPQESAARETPDLPTAGAHVSPTTIHVGLDGMVRVLPFCPGRNLTSMQMENPGYTAPERLRGFPPTRTGSLFGVGVLLFELLTARRLFDGDGDFERLNAVLERRIPLLRTLRPDLPPALESVLSRALEREPGARWPSVDLFANALRGSCGDERGKLEAVETRLGVSDLAWSRHG